MFFAQQAIVGLGIVLSSHSNLLDGVIQRDLDDIFIVLEVRFDFKTLACCLYSAFKKVFSW